MNIVPYVIAAIAGAALLSAGYLFGVRRGKVAREGLRELADSRVGELERLRGEVEVRTEESKRMSLRMEEESRRMAQRMEEESRRMALRMEEDASRLNAREDALSDLAESLGAALSAHQETLKSEIRRSVEGMAHLVGQREDGRQDLSVQMQEQFKQLEKRLSQAASRTDLDQLIRPLREREQHEERWRRDMTALLKPLAEKERRGHELSHMELGLVSRGELPILLDTIVSRVGLVAVVLTDAVGLPLAMSQNAEQGEVLAGISALLVNVRERTITAEQPAPYAFVVHDESHREILYRVFTLDDEEYVLIAIAQGLELTHDVLDPALPHVIQLLRVEAWRHAG